MGMSLTWRRVTSEGLHQGSGFRLFIASEIGAAWAWRAGRATFRIVRIPITNSHRQITVGPMIVRMRGAIVGSPVKAWTKPAPIDPLPAAAGVQPSQRG